MIIVTVAGRVKPEFKETFLTHMAELTKIVSEEEGCISYLQTISVKDSNTLFLYEEWESEQHLRTHLETEHMLAHFEEARPWFDSVEMKTFEVSEFALQ